MRTFNTEQASKFTGIPVQVLIRMRTDSTRRNDRRGPPFQRIMKGEQMVYRYKENELIKWLMRKNCSITANDAAYILEISRTEVLSLFGLYKAKVGDGELLIHSAKNFFLYLPRKKLKILKERKKKC